MSKGLYKSGMVYPTNKYGDVLILEYRRWDEVLIRFLDTQHELVCCMSQIKKGTIVDGSIGEIPNDLKPGSLHVTNSYGVLEVLEYMSYKEVKVEFKETGNTRVTRADSIRSGAVRDIDSSITVNKLRAIVGDSKSLTSGGILTVESYLGVSEGNLQYFSVTCSKCSKDKELHPVNFKTTYANWRSGCIPCPCSNSYTWSEDQYKVLIRRQLEVTEYQFREFSEGFKGNLTKCDIYCQRHDNTHKARIVDILSGKCPCDVCYTYNTRMNSVPKVTKRVGEDRERMFYVVRFTKGALTFIKSGACMWNGDVSKSLRKRYRLTDYPDYSYELLYYEVGPYQDISYIEIESQDTNCHKRFYNEELAQFNGSTECFTEYLHNGVLYK